MDEESKMNWSQDLVKKLIVLYRDNPVLWNQAMPQYRDIDVRNVVWNEIAQELQMSKAEVQRKMHNLNTIFTRVDRKKEGKLGLGADEAKVKWCFYDSMLFLKAKRQTPRRQTRKVENVTLSEDLYFELEDFKDSDDQDRPVTPGTDNSPIACGSTATNETSSVQRINVAKRKRKVNPVVEKSFQPMTTLEQKVKQRDEYDVFGEHVACQLRKMKYDRNKAIARNQINKVLFNIEMNELEAQSTSTKRK